MRVIEPRQRIRPFVTPRTHARVRHDWATWHEDHVHEALRVMSRRLPDQNELPYHDRSKFDSARIIQEAIERSYEHPAVLAKNGNHVVVFDLGYIVGFDKRANRETSAVTVVILPNGEVITAHPGTPWSSDQSRA
jgi:hypothetical protein